MKECETCSASFVLHASEAKTKGRGRFCSFVCYRKFTGESSIEKITRELIEGAGFGLVQEFSIGGKDVFDFYIPAINVLIECDGTYWHAKPEVKERDAAKEARAISAGYRVVRFTEEQIKHDSFSEHLGHALSLVIPHPQLRLYL